MVAHLVTADLRALLAAAYLAGLKAPQLPVTVLPARRPKENPR